MLCQPQEKELGPNGGLVFCMEYLMDNMDWLSDNLGDYSDDYILFDCPGQIELFTHVPVMPRFCQYLQQVCIYCTCPCGSPPSIEGYKGESWSIVCMGSCMLLCREPAKKKDTFWIDLLLDWFLFGGSVDLRA